MAAVLLLSGCESTKTTATAPTTEKTAPAVQTGNPEAAYQVISKELTREPENEDLQAAQNQYGTEVVERLLAQLANVPETNLSVREAILEEAQGYASAHREKIASELESLGQTRRKILATWNENADSSQTIDEVVQAAGPFARYALTDVDLREAFLNSRLVARIANTIREHAANGRYHDARALQQSVAASEYGRMIAPRLDEALFDGARVYVNAELDRRYRTIRPLPGERAIWSALLGDPEHQLTLAVIAAEGSDAKLTAAVHASTQDYFGATFDAVPLEPAALENAPNSDVFVVVDVSRNEVTTVERTEERPSQFVKAYQEVTNPEYEAAYKEWSFAQSELDSLQEHYEQELVAYQEDEERMANSVDPSTVNAILALAEFTGGSPPPMDDMPRSGLVTARQPPPPPDPTRHAIATRRLQATPRKIREPVFQEYHYSARIVEARYDGAASLDVVDRLSLAIESKDNVSYTHEKSWTDTQGVHVRDANRVAGDLTDRSIEIEHELFLEALAADLSEATRELLITRARGLLRQASEQQQPGPLTFGLALYAATQRPHEFQLTTAEIAQLAEDLADSDPSSAAWRLSALEHVIRKSDLDSLASPDTASRLMERPAQTEADRSGTARVVRRLLDE